MDNKKYRTFRIKETQEVKDFVAYCKKHNIIAGRELITAIKQYLQNKKQGA